MSCNPGFLPQIPCILFWVSGSPRALWRPPTTSRVARAISEIVANHERFPKSGIFVIYNVSGNFGNAVILRTPQSVEIKITFIAT